jgi:hypothetical protein
VTDNNLALYISELFLKKSNKSYTKENVVKFFISVIDFHQLDNKQKYNVIYNRK